MLTVIWGFDAQAVAVCCWRMDPSGILQGSSTACWHLPGEDLVLSTQEMDEVLNAEGDLFPFSCSDSRCDFKLVETVFLVLYFLVI